jgi:hypothetical protein
MLLIKDVQDFIGKGSSTCTTIVIEFFNMWKEAVLRACRSAARGKSKLGLNRPVGRISRTVSKGKEQQIKSH